MFLAKCLFVDWGRSANIWVVHGRKPIDNIIHFVRDN